MPPKGGHELSGPHFDRAESEGFDADTRAQLSERSEFWARRIKAL